MDVSYEMLKDIVFIQSITINNLNTEISILQTVLEYGPVYFGRPSASADTVTKLIDRFEEKYNVSYFSVISTICKIT